MVPLPLTAPPDPPLGDVAWPELDDWLALRVREVVTEDDAEIACGKSGHAVMVLLDEPERRTPNGLPAFGKRWGGSNRVGRLLFAAFNSTLPAGLKLEVPWPHFIGWGEMTGDGGLESRGRRTLGPARAVVTALALDLRDLDIKEMAVISGRLPDPRYSGALAWKSPARHTRDAAREGRRILAGLGAWPWVHADSDDLPTEWWTCSTFIEPLSDWRRRCVSSYLALGLRAATPT